MTGHSSVGSYLSTIYSLMYVLPPSYLYLTTVMVSLIAVLLLFKGRTAWDLMFLAVGAYYGFVFALYLTALLHANNIPIYLIFIIGGVLGAIIMREFVRIALPGGLGILAFLVADQAYPQGMMTDIMIGVIIFGICYALYSRITMVLASIIGAFLLWFNLSVMGVPSYAAQAVAGALFTFGLYLQIMEKKRKKEEQRRLTAMKYGRLSRITLVKKKVPQRNFMDEESFSEFY